MTDVAAQRGNWLVWRGTALNLDRIRSIAVAVARTDEIVDRDSDGEPTGTHDQPVAWHLTALDDQGQRHPVSGEYGSEHAAAAALDGLLSPWDALQAVT